tara:strand:- start:1699 stop:3432 length:1734 start_codon:yes stop_codon:yes gene_type:complete
MRVIKWVDENGTIKTSVTCMPPNAKSIADSSSLTNGTAKANASASNDTFYPTFEAHTTDVNEDNLHEVAKTFYAREFGNGSANGGTGATYADASMLSGNDAIAYVMDDGLTSFSSDDIERNVSHRSLTLWSGDDFIYITFIGTGITVSGDEFFGTRTIAQNLPYGTHILKIVRDSNGKSVYSLDGVSIFTSSETNFGEVLEVTFHQPKKPLIPEDAVVLCDYMLMADFVPQTSAGLDYISKGVRACSAGRDMLYNHPSGTQQTNPFLPDPASARFGDSYWVGNSNGLVATRELVCFGNSFSVNWFQANNELPGTYQITAGQDGTTDLTNYTRASNSAGSSGAVATNGTVTRNNGTASGNYMTAVAGASVPLGVQTIKTTSTHTNVAQYEYVNQISIHTPIHTSSHYQSFESKFLHELIGGDRNMEQTNLVCSPDGKTWGEVTRDTSYIGNLLLTATPTGTHSDDGGVNIYTEFRGSTSTSIVGRDHFNKDFAIAYDRFICLVSGQYEINIRNYTNTANPNVARIYINGAEVSRGYNIEDIGTSTNIYSTNLNRGDYVQVFGKSTADVAMNYIQITRV